MCKAIISLFCYALIGLGNGYAQSAEDPQVWLQQAEAAMEAGKVKEAHLDFSRAYAAYQQMDDAKGIIRSGYGLADTYINRYKIDSAKMILLDILPYGKEANAGQEVEKSYLMLIQIASIRGNHDESIAQSLECMEWQKKAKHIGPYGKCALLAGIGYISKLQLDSAFWYLQEAKKALSEVKDTVFLIRTHDQLGRIYARQAESGKAVGEFMQAIAYAEQQQAETKPPLIIALVNLSNHLIQEELYERARPYAERARDLATEPGLRISRAGATVNLGQIAEHTGELDLAEQYYGEAITLFQKSRLKVREVLPTLNLINVLYKLNRFEAAEERIVRSYEILEKVKNPLSLLQLYTLHAYLLNYKGQWQEAKIKYEQALALAREHDNLDYQILSLQRLAYLYNDRSQHAEAYQMLLESNTLKDSLADIRQSELAQDLDARYNRTQQDREIERLNYTAEIQTLEILAARRQRWMLGGGVLFALGLAGMGFYLFFDKRKTSAQLSKQNTIIEKALSEKDLLLREIHHRVKNNLQVISSLLSLQSRYIEDPRAVQAINEGRSRVRSMALIHQNLYQGENLTDVPVKDYFDRLLSELFETYRVDEDRIQLQTDIAALDIDVDTVVPIGLILNELVSNALKYAFPDERKGIIRVELRKQGQTLHLQVSDDGIGVKNPTPFENPTSFGHRLIKALSNKLEADLSLESNGGTKVIIAIPEEQ